MSISIRVCCGVPKMGGGQGGKEEKVGITSTLAGTYSLERGLAIYKH